MKAFVFTDEALREHAGRFVWLEIDTEKAENAAFRQQFPVRALPTYLVIEPAREQVVLRWVGGATVAQLVQLFEEAETNFRRVRGDASTEQPVASAEPSETAQADSLLTQADLLYGEGKSAEAAALYERAIAGASVEWPSYSRAVEGLLINWVLDGNCDPAVRLAREVYPRLSSTTSLAVVASVGLDCALELPEDHEGRDEAITFFETAARRAVSDRSIPIAADDRSGVYISLYSARAAAEDSVGAHQVATEWAAFLEEAAAAAPSPAARAVFDSHRLGAYMRLGEVAKAVPMLEQSERDFPDDYNPSSRLAIAYRELGQLDEALAASQRAADRAYGPRLLGILQTRADLFLARGDSMAARGVLEQALSQAMAMPEGQRSDRRIAGFEEQLATLPAAVDP